MTGFQVDLICGGIILFFGIIGLFRGFLAQVYDLLSFFLCIFLSIVFSPLISRNISIVHTGYDSLSSIEMFINHMIVFVVVFVILLIFFKIVGFFLKKFFKFLNDVLHITDALDRVLGMLFSMIKGLVIVYIGMLVMVSPLLNMNELVESTEVSKYILQITPDFNQFVESTIDIVSTCSSNEGIDVLLQLNSLHLLSDELFADIFDDYYTKTVSDSKMSLSQDKANQLYHVLQLNHSNDELIQIFKFIKVS